MGKLPPFKVKKASTFSAMKAACKQFLQGTSLRGLSKAYLSPHRIMRLLWLLFFFGMTVFLMTLVTWAIMDYHLYDVSVQTKVLQMSSPFPSLTVCHHNPFSAKASELWDKGVVPSPKQFNQQIRRMALTNLEAGELEEMDSLLAYDSLSIYYQNILLNESIAMGHTYAAFPISVRKFGAMMTFEEDCQQLEGFKVRRLSTHSNFNCYTFEPSDLYSANNTTFLGVIVSLASPTKSPAIQEGFLIDILEQAEGLRVLVHDNGILPDLESNFIHIEPGKLHEIVYQPNLWYRVHTPKRPCLYSHATNHIHDMLDEYKYSYEQCIKERQQRRLMKNCGCMMAFYPRLQLPSSEMPYCGSFKPNITTFLQRLQCIGTFLQSTEERYQQEEDRKQCVPLCEEYEYDASNSITEWRVNMWQLEWIVRKQRYYKALKKYFNQSGDTVHQLMFDKSYNDLRELLKMENLSSIDLNITTAWSPYASSPNMGKKFAYVILRRKTNDAVTISTERLVISMNTLFSRIGGLCSLCIGLTASFLCELLEFVFNYLFMKRKAAHNAALATNALGQVKMATAPLHLVCRRQNHEVQNLSGDAPEAFETEDSPWLRLSNDGDTNS